MQSAQKHVETLLRSLPMNKSLMERLRDLKSRPNRPCLTRSRPKDSRVGNRAAHAALDWEQRGCSKSKEATDSGAIHRATCMRRREKTLPVLNTFVAVAGPVHLSRVLCPPESDRKAHNDYKAKVRDVCVYVCVRARASVCVRVSE